MTVSTLGIAGELNWSLQKDNTGFAKSKQGPDKLSVTLSPNILLYTQIYAAEIALTTGQQTVLDFFDGIRNLVVPGSPATLGPNIAMVDFLYDAIAFRKVLGIMVQAVGVSIKVEPGAIVAATDPMSWFLSGTTPAITIKAGGFFLVGDGNSTAVATTSGKIKITNMGAITGSVKIALLGGPT